MELSRGACAEQDSASRCRAHICLALSLVRSARSPSTHLLCSFGALVATPANQMRAPRVLSWALICALEEGRWGKGTGGGQAAVQRRVDCRMPAMLGELESSRELGLRPAPNVSSPGRQLAKLQGSSGLVSVGIHFATSTTTRSIFTPAQSAADRAFLTRTTRACPRSP